MKFNIPEAIADAWKLLWADNLKRRAEGATYRTSETYFLTASDLVNQVRQFAGEALAGEKRGTRGRAYGAYLDQVRIRGDLLGEVRRWLDNEKWAGRLVYHNFGRGHISGARWRPAGEPLAEAEQTTIKDKSRVKPVHLSGGRPGRRAPACVTLKPSRGYSRSSAHITSERERVTCPRCLKLPMVCEAAETQVWSQL